MQALLSIIRFDPEWPRGLGLAFLGVGLLNLALLHGVINGWYCRIFPAPIGPTPFGLDDASRYQRLRRLAEDHGLHGPVFTDYNIGSLVEYELYPQPGYVDNRPEAFPFAFWQEEYLPSLALGERWQQVCEKRDFNAIVVSPPGVKESFVQALQHDPRWILIHLDEITAVWVGNRERNAAILRALAWDGQRLAAYERMISEQLLALPDQPWWRRPREADRLAYELYGLICLGENARAWPYLWQLYLLYPDYQIVHELLRVTAPHQAWDRLEPVFARHARWPLAAKQVVDWGRCLQSRGRTQEARQVYRRGRVFFPLSPALREAANQEDLDDG